MPCTYATTVEIDVAELVVAATHRLENVSRPDLGDRHREFRMALTDAGAPATWRVVHPAFTVSNPARETFEVVWTQYEEASATHPAATPGRAQLPDWIIG